MATKATQAAKAAAGKAAQAAQTLTSARAKAASVKAASARAKGAGASGPTDYDAIIVGGGHNGLVAAAYLARSGARTLVLEARPKTGGAATTEAPWPDAPGLQGHPAVLRDVTAAADHHQRPSARPARLQDLPDGPVLPGLSRGRVDQAVRRRRQAQPRRGRRLVEEGRRRHARWDAWLAGLADVLGPLLLTVPPNLGSRKPRDLDADPAAGLAPPRPGRAHDRRCDPADDDDASPTCSTTGSSRRRSRGRWPSTG